MKIKIKRSPKTECAALDILAVILGCEYTNRRDAVVSVSHDGHLLCYNAACGIDDGETVLYARLEPDSMGDGWESATASDVIDWLETNCSA